MPAIQREQRPVSHLFQAFALGEFSMLFRLMRAGRNSGLSSVAVLLAVVAALGAVTLLDITTAQAQFDENAAPPAEAAPAPAAPAPGAAAAPAEAPPES